MKKNEPLRSRRLIFKVLGIGFFLFCAATFFFPLPAAAFTFEENFDSYSPYPVKICGQDGYIEDGSHKCDNAYTSDEHYFSPPYSLKVPSANNSFGYNNTIGIFPYGNFSVEVFKNTCPYAYGNGHFDFGYYDGYGFYPLFVFNSCDLGGSGYPTIWTQAAGTVVYSSSTLPTGSWGTLNGSWDIATQLLTIWTGSDEPIQLSFPALASHYVSAFHFYGAGVLATYYDDLTIDSSSPVVPGDLSSAGVLIAPNWFCCEGSCGYPISMLPQGGWWGIGSTTPREIKWSIDNSTTTNSIDFTNRTNYLIQIPTSTPLSYHVLHVETYLAGNLIATGSVQIQIVAAADCINTSPDQFNSFCASPCAGLATSTSPLDLENFICGLREFGCWLVIPTPSSISYVMGQFNGLTANFPLAPFKKLYDDLNLAATGTQAVAPGNIEIPFYSTSSHQYVGVNFDLGSSTLSHSYGWVKFRRLEVIGGWCLGILPMIIILIKLIV